MKWYGYRAAKNFAIQEALTLQISSEKEQVGNAFGSQFPLVIVILLVFSALQYMYGSAQYRYQRRSEATAM